MSTTSLGAPDLWITRPVPLASARLRLFCLPHAGSGTAQFRPWASLLPPGVELCPIRLPGRESRLGERPFTRLQGAVEAVAEAIQPYLDRPFAFFGHSMGALLSFELTRHLQRVGQALPLQVFLSGRRAPHLPERESPMHGLPDDEFIAELARRYGDSSASLLRDPELRPIFLPVLRADFEAVETYTLVPGARLGCAVTAFGGLADPRADEAELDGWREHTRASFSLRRFPGDHFFLHSARAPLLAEVASTLRAALA